MNKSIFNTAVAVSVVAVFSIGCSEKPDDDEGGGGGGKGNNISNYRTVKIGSQTWMAENLDYAVSSSVCYNNDATNCAKYGRLYDWETALTACPSGWHLPSDAEWNSLFGSVGISIHAQKLKAQNGWNNCGPAGSGKAYVCEDAFGFAALPGGGGDSEGNFYVAGEAGNWWSASENDDDSAHSLAMRSEYEYARLYEDSGKDGLLSVRCVQD